MKLTNPEEHKTSLVPFVRWTPGLLSQRRPGIFFRIVIRISWDWFLLSYGPTGIWKSFRVLFLEGPLVGSEVDWADACILYRKVNRWPVPNSHPLILLFQIWGKN